MSRLKHSGFCLVHLILIVSLYVAAPALAATGSATTRVVYAGFAMLGGDHQLATLYPYSKPLEARFSKALYARAKQLQPTHYQLIADQLADSDRGDTVSMALVLDHEKVSIERVAGVYKVLVDISAQVVVFDFDGSERAIIASYAVLVPRYIESFDTKPSHKQIAALVEGIYFGGLDDAKNMIDAFSEIAISAPIKQKYAAEIGVGQVLVSPTVQALLPTYFQQDPLNVTFSFGRRLASELTIAQGVSVVPVQVDSSLASMSLRFTGQRQATFLNLPTPDYFIDMAVVDLNKHLFEESLGGDSYIYGAEVHFQVRYAGPNQDALFDQRVKHGVSKLVPATQQQVDDWSAREASLYGLFGEFAAQAGKPSRRWLKNQGYERAQRAQFKSLAEVLKLCR